MLGVALLRCSLAQLAFRLLELNSIEKLATLVALIATCIIIVALRADSIHVPVRKEPLT